MGNSALAGTSDIGSKRIGSASPDNGRTVMPSTAATPGLRSSTEVKKPRMKMKTPLVGLVKQKYSDVST